uniref:Cytochrome c oxidase subunit 2 n=1 Tax=Gyrodactylus kobayashii TaxID=89149 RepID=A0A161H5R7_9PLAT|nr:cytochrome c oxidase subunit II [Gyrodactylus kobayashii]AMZ79735.1 cytochrome c oxidase subunit II [Gyrodactylus kobayashii]
MSLSLIYYDIATYTILLCTFLCILVIYYLFELGMLYNSNLMLSNEWNLLEFVWTLIPTLLVSVLCILNLSFIYFDSELEAEELVKVIGRQWYWSYDDSFNGFYDSYYSEALTYNVDNPMVLRFNKTTRILVSSSDVIHSFSVPDLGLKMDGIPGRINHLTYLPDRVGVFVGYCSELCGVGHSFMPICIEVVKN